MDVNQLRVRLLIAGVFEIRGEPNGHDPRCEGPTKLEVFYSKFCLQYVVLDSLTTSDTSHSRKGLSETSHQNHFEITSQGCPLDSVNENSEFTDSKTPVEVASSGHSGSNTDPKEINVLWRRVATKTQPEQQ